MRTLTLATTRPALAELPAIEAGIYVTDGKRLFRVVSPDRSLFPTAELEDCATLEIESFASDELYAMHLRRVPILP